MARTLQTSSFQNSGGGGTVSVSFSYWIICGMEATELFKVFLLGLDWFIRVFSASMSSFLEKLFDGRFTKRKLFTMQ